MDELKPCPFCGSNRIIEDTATDNTGAIPMTVWFVKCAVCGSFKNSISNHSRAMKRWNTRPIEDALKAEVERLETDLVIQKNLARQVCFDAQRAYAETDKWKKMFYDLIDTQAKVSTQINAPDTNVGAIESEGEDE